jgi:2-iminobutanoate/2-iminopropanoate deaminase
MTRREIDLPELGPKLPHYAQAVAHGDLLFVSGLLAVDREQRIVGAGDVVAQAAKIFESMRSILEHVGASPAEVLKVTIFLTDMEDRPKITPLRQQFFSPGRPASTLVEVSALAVPDALIEIEAVVGLPHLSA